MALPEDSVEIIWVKNIVGVKPFQGPYTDRRYYMRSNMILLGVDKQDAMQWINSGMAALPKKTQRQTWKAELVAK